MATTNDIFEWLYDQGTTGSAADRAKTYMTGLGYSGDMNEAMYKWLGSLGHTGALTERINAFERANTGKV